MIENASSNCLVQTLTKAEASKSIIRGSLNCNGRGKERILFNALHCNRLYYAVFNAIEGANCSYARCWEDKLNY